MINIRLICLSVSSLIVFASAANVALAQGQAIERNAPVVQQQTKKITVKGKIAFMKYLGGYYVNGEDPAGEYMIVNMNNKVLKKLMKSRKTVSIEGHLTMGADNLFIEKIDGKKYIGN